MCFHSKTRFGIKNIAFCMGGVQNGVKKLTPLTQKKNRPAKNHLFFTFEIHFDC